MKASKFNEMTTQELSAREKELKEESFNLRFRLATGQLQNPLTVREIRRDIARVKTLLREREIKATATKGV
jgi:large subunit ribosomal protein L29